MTAYTPSATATNENTEAMMRPGNVSETSGQLPTMCSTSAQHINASTSVTVSRHATRAANATSAAMTAVSRSQGHQGPASIHAARPAQPPAGRSR